MNAYRFGIVCALVALASTVAAEQIEIPDWENSVQFRLVASQQPIRPGDSFKVALVADIEEGYHLYGPEEPYPSGTELAVEGTNVEVGEATFPPVEKRELSGLGTYDLFEGSIAIQVPVTLTMSGTADEHTLKATVNYQVCTDYACSAPTSDELEITIAGAAAGADVDDAQHAEIFEPK